MNAADEKDNDSNKENKIINTVEQNESNHQTPTFKINLLTTGEKCLPVITANNIMENMENGVGEINNNSLYLKQNILSDNISSDKKYDKNSNLTIVVAAVEKTTTAKVVEFVEQISAIKKSEQIVTNDDIQNIDESIKSEIISSTNSNKNMDDNIQIKVVDKKNDKNLSETDKIDNEKLHTESERIILGDESTNKLNDLAENNCVNRQNDESSVINNNNNYERIENNENGESCSFQITILHSSYIKIVQYWYYNF